MNLSTFVLLAMFLNGFIVGAVNRPGLLSLGRWLRDRLRRRVPGDAAWAQLNVHLDMMVEMLGPNYELEHTTTSKGREVRLVCRRCKRNNRLVQGFANAACGGCHEALVPRVKPAALPLNNVN